jgi:predicted transposase YdaD
VSPTPRWCNHLCISDYFKPGQSIVETDNSLKMLITEFSETFAEWLLGNAPQQVRPLNVELPAAPTRSDLIFEVVEADDQVTLLHIELQGPGSHEPMAWRMLSYIERLAQRELGTRLPGSSTRLESVVIYLQGAGANDSGQYELVGRDDRPTLTWRYQPILLWKMQPEALLTLERPALLALVGQTQLDEPERVLPEVIAKMRQVQDIVQRKRMLMMLESLTSDKEALEIMEQILDPLDEYLMELPYQKRIRERALAEGLAEGKALGLAEGLIETTQCLSQTLRETVLEVIRLRFNPAALQYHPLIQRLATITDQEALRRLHTAAIIAPDLAAFTTALTQESPQAE